MGANPSDNLDREACHGYYVSAHNNYIEPPDIVTRITPCDRKRSSLNCWGQTSNVMDQPYIIMYTSCNLALALQAALCSAQPAYVGEQEQEVSADTETRCLIIAVSLHSIPS